MSCASPLAANLDASPALAADDGDEGAARERWRWSLDHPSIGMESETDPELADADASPEHFVGVARWLWGIVAHQFGAPETLVARDLTRRQSQHIGVWLRPIERLVAGALLLLALLCPYPGAPAPARRRPPSPAPAPRPPRARRLEDPADPDSWAVRFQIPFPAAQPLRPTPRATSLNRPCGPFPPHAAYPSGRAWARRMEALLRVLNDPPAHADGLARRLAQRRLRGLPHVPRLEFRESGDWRRVGASPCRTALARCHARCRELLGLPVFRPPPRPKRLLRPPW